MLNKLDAAFLYAKVIIETKVKEFLFNEDGAVNILEIVVLIGIVIIIAGIFRKQIGALVDKLIGSIGTNAENAINGSSN